MSAFVRALKELRGGWLHAEARWINAEVSIRMLEEQARRLAPPPQQQKSRASRATATCTNALCEAQVA